MQPIRPTAIVLALLLFTPGFLSLAAAANWEPDEGDWSHFRRTATHSGATGAVGAFTTSLGDLRIKWQRTDDPGYWVPPVAADLDNDGVAEVVSVVGNASADPTNLQNPVSLESGLNVLNGATGALKWQVAPQTGYLDFFSPALGDIDGDGFGEVVFMHGNPLTGTFSTNQIRAYEHDGTQKWAWSDTAWGAKVPETLNSLTIADVDGESGRKEVVAVVLLANVLTTVQGGVVVIQGSNPETRVYALNGEGSSASVSWAKASIATGTASNPAVGDLNKDGIGDVVWGQGARPGVLVDTGAARIEVANAFFDERIIANKGGAAQSTLWEYNTNDVPPGELGSAPVIVDLDQDGSLEVVQPLWLRNVPPGTTEVSDIVALNSDGTEKWKTRINAAPAAEIAVVPPAVGDLDADGKPDLVIQTANGDSVNRYRAIALKHDGTVLWRSATFGRIITSGPALGDLTGDGKPEVMVILNTVTGGSSQLVVLNGQTGGELYRYNIDERVSVGGPVLADLDGDDDGRLEVLLNAGFWGEPGRILALEPELPDLRLTNLQFSAAEHLHGVAETVSATVANIGSRTATNALVRFTDNGATLHEATLTLSPGGSQVVSFTWTPASVGARTIVAEADPGKAIPEWAENNQRESRGVTVRAPELRFATGDPTFSDPTPGVGDTITVSATITNGGGKDATNVLVRFVDGGVTFAEQTLPSLAKGASQAVSAPLTVAGEFDRTIEVLADPLDAIVEEDEANNRAAKLLDVIFIAPDLVLSNLVFSNPTPGAEETITVTVSVDNLGSKDAGAFVVRFLDEGVAFGEVTVPGLLEGAGTAVSKDLLVLGEFPHTVTVVADPDGLLNEEDETNNVVSGVLNVLAPDLSLVGADLSLSDPNPDEFDVLTVTATVRNVGTGGRVPQNVLVRLLDGGAVVAEDTIGSIPAGGSGQAFLDYLIAGVGPRTLDVVVDPLGAVNELNELNNAADVSLVVGKVAVGITMSQATYPFQARADGVARLAFRSTGVPLAGYEFIIPVEYVLTTASGTPAGEFARLAGAALARLAAASDQRLELCSMGRCVELTTNLEATLGQLLGGGAGAGDFGELTLRVATIEAKTNALGEAAFVVPYSAFQGLDGFQGISGVSLCLKGFDDLLVQLPAPVPPCATQTGSFPAPPAVANLPGRYRATGVVDWYGFVFSGRAEWVHI